MYKMISIRNVPVQKVEFENLTPTQDLRICFKYNKQPYYKASPVIDQTYLSNGRMHLTNK